MIGIPEGASYLVTAEVLGDVTVCSFTRTRMMEMITKYPELAARVIVKFQGEHDRGQSQMLALGRLTAKEWVAGFLLMLMYKTPECADGDGPFTLQMKRADIADYLGVTVETVSRSFTKLRKAGVIESGGNADVTVPNSDRLEDVAGGEM
ncbi:MAG: Crp/Fnr family transcriptional regulator [Rhodospirillaceae bacterium]